MPSFDVVSVVNMQEVDNAVNQAIKEIGQRYDFKGTKTEVTLDKDGIKVLTDDDYRLKAVVDVPQSKFVKRGVSLKALQYGKVEPASGGCIRQVIAIQQGISTEKGKEIVAIIKQTKLKVCLLYTSDAADEEDSVDLGGRRIINKKKTSQDFAIEQQT